MNYQLYRLTLVLLLCGLLFGCGALVRRLDSLSGDSGSYPRATSHDPSLMTHPPHIELQHYKPAQERRTQLAQHGAVTVALAASGGGYRAANFTAGVLLGLEEILVPRNNSNMLQEIDYFSSVSGGGFAIGMYEANLYDHVMQYGKTRPFSFKRVFYDRGDPQALKLRVNYADELFFGRHSLRLEQLLGRSLLMVSPDRQLQLGDVFVPKNSNDKVILPMWVMNASIIQNLQLFQFTPDVISRYKLINYMHDFKRYPIVRDAPIYGFEIPVAVGMMASATFPYAVTGTTLRSDACKGPCYLQLFDGGMVDNLGLLSLIDILNQDSAGVQIIILVDADSSNLEPFSAQQDPPQKLALLERLLKSTSEAFHHNIKNYVDIIMESLACASGGKKVIVVTLDMSKYPKAREISTKMWLTPEEQYDLVEAGKAVVRHNKTLTQEIPQLLAAL